MCRANGGGAIANARHAGRLAARGLDMAAAGVALGKRAQSTATACTNDACSTVESALNALRFVSIAPAIWPDASAADS